MLEKGGISKLLEGSTSTYGKSSAKNRFFMYQLW